MTIRVCTIGCGGMANLGHGPAYIRYGKLNGGIDLAACCDIDPQKAQAFRKCYGFERAYTDYRKMLDEVKPDAVTLLVQEEVICEIACDIFKRGYPLLLEKPPGMTVEEIDTMLEIAQANNIPHQVALNRRFAPLHQRMRNLIKENSKPQELQHIIYTFSRFDRRDDDFSLTAIHGIDTVRFLIDADYEWVRFDYQNQPSKGGHVYNVQMNCQLTNGITGHISFCPVTGTVIERADVLALDKSYHMTMPLGPIEDMPSHPGSLEYYAYNELVEKTNAQTFTKSEEFDILNGFYGENASFFDDIKAGRSPVYTLDVIRQSVAIMECIRNRQDEYRLHPQ